MFTSPETKKSTDRTLLRKMIYNTSKWQSIKKTNQESEYLQFCRTKSCYIVQRTFLLILCCFNFVALQDPWWLLYVHFKSSSSYWMNLSPKFKVFIQNSSWFILLRLQFHLRVTFSPPGYNFTFGLQFHLWVTISPLGYNFTFGLQCNPITS